MPCSPPVQPKVSGPKSIIDVIPRRRGLRLRSGKAKGGASEAEDMGFGLERGERRGESREGTPIAEEATAPCLFSSRLSPLAYLSPDQCSVFTRRGSASSTAGAGEA